MSEGRRLVSEFPVGKGAPLAILQNRHDGDVAVAMTEKILGEIQARVGEPPAAGKPFAVEDYGSSAALANNLAEVPYRLPELAPMFDGIAVQRRVVGRRESESSGEPRQVRIGDGGGTRPPQFVRHRKPSPSHVVRRGLLGRQGENASLGAPMERQ